MNRVPVTYASVWQTLLSGVLSPSQCLLLTYPQFPTSIPNPETIKKMYLYLYKITHL